MGNQIKRTGPKPRVYTNAQVLKAWKLYITENRTATDVARTMKTTVYQVQKMIAQAEAQGLAK